MPLLFHHNGRIRAHPALRSANSICEQFIERLRQIVLGITRIGSFCG